MKLGVDQGTLDAIELSNHHRVDDCFPKMIVTWLRSHEATQDKLKEALSVDVMEGIVGMFVYMVCSIVPYFTG